MKGKMTMAKNKRPAKPKSFVERYKTPIFAVLFAIIIVMAIVLIICVENYNKAPDAEPLPFVPPSFDEGAVMGDPKDLGIGEKEGYSVISDPTKIPYSAGMCGIFDVNENGEADIYFHNPETNNVWLKIRVYGTDPKTDIVAETGLIKPGEYIKTITFRREIVKGEDLTAKVMSYVPEEYTSAGSFNLKPYVKSPFEPKGGCESSLAVPGALVTITTAIAVVAFAKKKREDN